MSGSHKPRVLVSDDYSLFLALIKNELLKEKKYEVRTVSDGHDCLKQLDKFQPDLVILGLTLPGVHGMDILKKIKSDPKKKHVGVIISSRKALVQDYEIAIEKGADYYLIKPFPPHHIAHLVAEFFSGNLKPAPFYKLVQQECPIGGYYKPSSRSMNSYFKLWGTRGSIPVAGPEYVSFGGNTPCLEICEPDSLIIIDAGTGIRPLGEKILASPFKEIHLFIGHTHWDHIIGFPFFAPVYYSEYTIHIYSAVGYGRSVQELFKSMLERDYFPVKLDEMRSKFIFHDLQPDTKPIKIGQTSIHYTYASHPGATLCFKIESLHQMIGYATDNEFLVGYHGDPNGIDIDHSRLEPYKTMIDFFSNCDLLIHEAQYTPEEYLKKVGWGHSSVSNACVLVKYCGVKEWIVTHHDPSHQDEKLRSMLKLHQDILHDCSIDCQVNMAYDGLIYPL